ncbi:diacylglycerol kinase theta isoform X3 [Chrysoperla carnea]|uniref:diacylglycerol kinase theta isoform X3 n=1 Tax=Chrysoperla carnea TaxID=189513 RepID=UPI001D07A418|nr:diacylglycerol kinase theta isoform X3 [Chrysoperla carnea]
MAVPPPPGALQHYHGHTFGKKTFHKPTYCHHCSDMLWGLIQQGFICEVCNFVVHDRCLKTVVSPCSSIAASLIKNPVAHCWSEQIHHKKKFCNVCRKRLDDSLSIHCEICDYFVHVECQDFAVADCKENATYLPGKELSWVRHEHHWREGNLPTNSKCAVCKKTCWASECLTGFRCEWCGITSHAICRCNIPPECTFGNLEPIYLPPHAVSIPRTEVPMEAIIGVQVRRKDTMSREYSCLNDMTMTMTPSYNIMMINIMMDDQQVNENDNDNIDHNTQNNNNNKSISSIIIEYLSFVLPRSCRYKYQAPYSPPYYRARSISEEFTTGSGGGGAGPGSGGGIGNSGGGGGSTTTSGNVSNETRYRDNEDVILSQHVSRSDKQKDKQQEERDEEIVKVYDGNNSYRRRIFRTINVCRTAPLEHVLTLALRAFHITKDPSAFYLTDVYGGGSGGGNGSGGNDININNEIPLQDPQPILSLIKKENKRPAVFLRFKDKDNECGEVRVYPGKLQVNTTQQSQSYCCIKVTSDTTITDLIKQSLIEFGLSSDGSSSDQYRLSEILLDRGVSERVLSYNERPWEIMKQLGKDSIRQMELMRFYLQLKQDPHGPNLALFVGNLPPGLSERNYEMMLLEFLGKENKFTQIGPIYYEYGSMVIIYEDSNKAVRALYTLRESKYEDKHLLVMLLPNIEPSMVPNNVQPLLVFVNVKSGGCQGLELISSFRKLLNPYQVFDLDNGGPLPGLYVFRHIKNYKILVCGGDGTIGWVLQCLDNVGQDSECSSPACAIVPLGTGNDLARVLRWGPGYTGGEDPLNLLRDVIDAEEIRLDRWTVVFHPEDKTIDTSTIDNTSTGGGGGGGANTNYNTSSSGGGANTGSGGGSVPGSNMLTKQVINTTVTTGSTSEDNSQIFVMNNYFGIGIDADLCLDFHNAREENPNKFNSRLHNKSVYVKMGLRKMVGRKMCKDLHKEIRLEVDGKLVELPQVEGIIILNILSWGSGANPWGPEKEDHFSKPNHWDGMLEVVGVTGVVHLGQIQSGFRSALRIAQGGHIKIHLHSDIPVQVDGEPWVQSPGDVVVLKSALKATMLKKNKIKRRLTEPNIHPSNGDGGGSKTNADE